MIEDVIDNGHRQNRVLPSTLLTRSAALTLRISPNGSNSRPPPYYDVPSPTSPTLRRSFPSVINVSDDEQSDCDSDSWLDGRCTAEDPLDEVRKALEAINIEVSTVSDIQDVISEQQDLLAEYSVRCYLKYPQLQLIALCRFLLPHISPWRTHRISVSNYFRNVCCVPLTDLMQTHLLVRLHQFGWTHLRVQYRLFSA